MNHSELCGICHTSGPCPHHTSVPTMLTFIGPGLVLPPDPKDAEIARLRAALAEAEAELAQCHKAINEQESRANRAEDRAESAERERDELAATWSAIAEGERKDVTKALAERDEARVQVDAACRERDHNARRGRAAEASLAQARAECDRLNAAVLALQEGRAGAERALAQAREVLRDFATLTWWVNAPGVTITFTDERRSGTEVRELANLRDAADRALASALGRGEGP